MDFSVQYWYLFIDSIMATLLLPIHEELVIDVLLAFKTHNKILMLVASLLGGAIGSMINYYLGKLLGKTREFVYKEHISESKSYKKYLFLNKYGYILVPFSYVKLLGGMVSFTAGFCNLNPILTLILIMLGRAIFYSIKIFGVI